MLNHSITPFTVNVLKERAWDGESQFDKNMDKSKFRAYEVARDRVKEFYSEQHGQLRV